MDPSALNSPELERFLTEEKERAMVNEMVAKLTSASWDKCIMSTPGSKLSSSESSCLSNCARSYMDMSLIIMKRFQSMN
ncbi:PREDICTED: mitochondrial import inner membrane translocase subunit TIM8 [Populus euphratica]|uniref:Mitochondrial import inner membrane translocase subunit n=1 Tax=Populus euphratica TaxID=75702 RepID=A0AAJ6V8J0_POPEU|nr:PREDICTED: mitochondrial import inner membrane translocase subunit TIM8 [Populus euphratica]